ncbi:YihY/virulence factor BrkB family protein [Actinoplanes cyaneus]|uniref:YihY/virulence factor BrkB family protein n=1 Tax=Actinoplanes cyaneus TaxID=52696 RepID=UPI002225C756|nr:YihY/virulence factor BrkB family protein [Actinoplanes cyaneus]
MSPGGVLAVLLWIAASVGFGIYAAHFGSYNNTYGTLGGVAVFLVWLWISNISQRSRPTRTRERRVCCRAMPAERHRIGVVTRLPAGHRIKGRRHGQRITPVPRFIRGSLSDPLRTP